MTKIEVNPDAPKSLKEARGGDNKWALKHLPEQARIPYTTFVVPLARKKAGSLDPWENLTVEQIQSIVDDVFGKEKYKVTGDGVWYGLVGVTIISNIYALTNLIGDYVSVAGLAQWVRAKRTRHD